MQIKIITHRILHRINIGFMKLSKLKPVYFLENVTALFAENSS